MNLSDELIIKYCEENEDEMFQLAVVELAAEEDEFMNFIQDESVVVEQLATSDNSCDNLIKCCEENEEVESSIELETEHDIEIFQPDESAEEEMFQLAVIQRSLEDDNMNLFR